jgi:hypothetical protein
MKASLIKLPQSETVQANGAPAMAATPVAPADANGALPAMQLLLQIERDARRAESVESLCFLMANETRRAVNARQIFLLLPRGTGWRMRLISSLSGVDRQSPLVRYMEQAAKRLFRRGTSDQVQSGNVQSGNLFDLCPPDAAAKLFPFAESIGTVLVARHSKRPLAALMAVRETPFSDAEQLTLQRLAETYAHAWVAMAGDRAPLIRRLRAPLILAASIAVVLALALVPVPMTALAPAEVVALEPAVIAAPLDGAIAEVTVSPNQNVKAGDTLFRLADTQAKGNLDIAARDVEVADAKVRQAMQRAFVDDTAKGEIAIARNELALKQAEMRYAAELLARMTVKAPRDGIALFADKRELIGRPLITGQRVMDIADPARTQVRLEVGAGDALVLGEGRAVRLFLDSDPLNPLFATIIRASAMTRANASGQHVFLADTRLTEGAMLPLGQRGTAQITGDKVSLGFYLFRRPIASLRQRFGW